MNRHPDALPRTALGFAAIAMTAMTFALTVVVPAALASHNDDAQMLTTGTNAAVGIEANSNRSRVDPHSDVAATQFRSG